MTALLGCLLLIGTGISVCAVVWIVREYRTEQRYAQLDAEWFITDTSGWTR
jgi:hypothetical protein